MAEMEENHANNVTLEIAQSLDEQKEEEYDEILTPLFSAPQDGCCVRCIKSVGNVIVYSVGLLVTLLFSLLLWISVVIVYILVKFRIHVIGLCCGKRKMVTKMKRVGWALDYLMFHLLFGFNFDKLLRVILENPPTKYFVTHFALIFFQTRYVLFLTRNSQSSAAGSNDCIPDYNLKHDYITYDTLYDCGRTTYSRLLPRCSKEHLTKLPPVDDVVNKLFLRDNDKHKFAPESELNLSILFGFYVRWFTHQFANTNERKHNYVGQPVGINLSQLYGASAAMEKHIRKYKNGELNSVIIDGQEFPPVINKFGFGGVNSNSNSKNAPCIVKAVSVETIGTTATSGVHDLTLPYTPRQHHDLDDVYVENSDGNLSRAVSSPYLNSPREQEADTQSRSNNNNNNNENENNNEKKDKDKDKNGGGVGDVRGAKRPSILSQSRFYHNVLPKASTSLELQTSSYKMFVNLNDKIFSSAYNDVAAVHGPDFFVIQLLFWRHHNYIARKLHKAYPDFDDEKIYQISKLCNIITCIKITLALYSDMGIVQTNLSAQFDFYDLENLYNTWMYKLCGPNRQLFPSNSTNVFIEFNFMYRWHQLIPPKIVMMNVNEVKKICTRGSNKKNNNSKKTGEKKRKSRTSSATATMIMVDIHQATDELSGEKEKEKEKTEKEKEKEKEKVEEQEELTLPYKNYVNMFTDEYGLERFLLSSSKTPAGKLCLNNTEEFLCKTAVKGAIKKSRLYGLESYNKYRERLGFEKYSSFEELTDDKETQLLLKEVYGDINMVEFYVGLFAETKEGKAIHGPFLTSIFASFVFSLITSSRLLRKNWNVMLTPVGKAIVTKYTTLNDLIYLHTRLNPGDINLRIKT